ncbi:hypothetical protein RJ640_006453 [Escallonia rubra]|uniref:Uncharacterized protein n=1 Tax=Escallonia rubra TaxID=112253 RepID=A0AA88RPF9_9ASTE|nr:hypothetical protein RJ640_006453 [Escallonia rubra]
MENALTFLKTPSVGTSPSSSLYERFRNSTSGSSLKNFGIWPDNILRERSRTLMPFNCFNDKGMVPSKREHGSGKKAQQVARVSYQSADCTGDPMLVALCNFPLKEAIQLANVFGDGSVQAVVHHVDRVKEGKIAYGLPKVEQVLEVRSIDSISMNLDKRRRRGDDLLNSGSGNDGDVAPGGGLLEGLEKRPRLVERVVKAEVGLVVGGGWTSPTMSSAVALIWWRSTTAAGGVTGDATMVIRGKRAGSGGSRHLGGALEG